MSDTHSVLDLCNMSVENTKYLNQIFELYSKDYTRFVDELSDIFGKNLYWWMTNFASRNIFLSNAYKHICIVLVAIENIERNRGIDRILAPRADIAEVISQYIAKKDYDIKVEIENSVDIYKNNIWLDFLNYIKMIGGGVEGKDYSQKGKKV